MGRYTFGIECSSDQLDPKCVPAWRHYRASPPTRNHPTARHHRHHRPTIPSHASTIPPHQYLAFVDPSPEPPLLLSPPFLLMVIAGLLLVLALRKSSSKEVPVEAIMIGARARLEDLVEHAIGEEEPHAGQRLVEAVIREQ